MDLDKIQIKGLQYFVWCIHDFQTHNQPLIMANFGQISKIAAMMVKRIDQEMAETDAKLSGLGKFKAEYFMAAEDFFHNLLSS